ncbi:hypothetical protein F5141DRAFT_1078520 [Pisolithus sp. B1]|nr:hypothetical protein F5141DRAFT_1078520 [Pisolithus sp. B1]
MRVTLYFHKADGFGEWRILVGTSGAKKLREFRKRDIKKFKIVYKKIKYLFFLLPSSGTLKWAVFG